MPTSNMSSTTCSEGESELRRGPWTFEEDNMLIHYITCHGEGRWNLLAKCAGLRRTGKSCRLRWLNYLKPDIKRGNLSPQEQLLILELHSKWGNRWSKIAAQLPGRTDNEIKNYWRTRVQKQACQLKIDSNSKKSLEALPRFWMPRLLEKTEQTSSQSQSSSSSFSSTKSENSEGASSMLTKSAPEELSSVQTVKEVTGSNKLGEKSSSSICSTDSMPILEQPENSGYSNPLINDCYHVDIASFDMEGFNQLDFSIIGSDENSISDCQMTYDDAAGSLWNMGELWEFRN